jgi:hypothetical protein
LSRTIRFPVAACPAQSAAGEAVARGSGPRVRLGEESERRRHRRQEKGTPMLRRAILLQLPLLILGGGATAQEPFHQELRSALPTVERYPQFGKFLYSDLKMGVSFGAQRKSDQMSLRATIQLYPSRADALKKTTDYIDSPGGPAPKGSPSGRKLGEGSWLSAEPGVAILYVHDGRTWLTLYLQALIPNVPPRMRVIPPLSSEDILFTETVARDVLARLTALGYASPSRR